MIDGLPKAGVDLGTADLIVGTSAGARAGAQLATGVLDQGVAMYERGEIPPLDLPVTFQEFITAVTHAAAGTTNRREAARRIANLEPLGAGLVAAADRTRMVRAHLPVDAWPQQRLEITVVDAYTGLRIAFDAASVLSLLDAVTPAARSPGSTRWSPSTE
jgi:NTE family protein